MDREAIILRHVDKTGRGIEIGPSHSPVAPKSEGYRVDIIDHMDRDGLIAKYREHNLRLENIEEVDFVWRGESYADLTGKTGHYDWIIASHLIEHTTDLIGFLNHCDEVLRDDGVISLAVPDKRYCFDRFRPITGLARLIDGHQNPGARHSPGTIARCSA
jgi:2-polyprenyl-3-methyl-5-hydroxy-6-metoxy-1,4-benzoquinol methylase